MESVILPLSRELMVVHGVHGVSNVTPIRSVVVDRWGGGGGTRSQSCYRYQERDGRPRGT